MEEMLNPRTNYDETVRILEGNEFAIEDPKDRGISVEDFIYIVPAKVEEPSLITRGRLVATANLMNNGRIRLVGTDNERKRKYHDKLRELFG